jgi:transglutaminase-like putative cysteine protease
MRLEIRYANEFLYAEPVTESHNLLRACPADSGEQRLFEYRVEVSPNTRIETYTDYWGTRVDEFGITAPHSMLRVFAESVVETGAPPQPVSDSPLSRYREVAVELSEYLRPSPHASWHPAIADLAAASVAGKETSLEVVGAIVDTVSATMSYAPGATYVGVDIGQVLAQGKGVCQDFAHLAISMYRSRGIPARYVSGYLYATDQTEAVQPTDPEVEIQTHAWVEVYVPDHGWWALDPTNHQPAGELHVKIGHGRDYQDVMPLRGVYHGDADHQLGVRVQITRERLAQMTEQQ